MPPTYIHKIGDSIQWAVPLTLTVDGTLQTDLSAWTPTCSFRTEQGLLLADASCAFAGTDLTIEVADTTAWPPGVKVQFDVRLRSTGGVVTTGTATFRTEGAISP